jgi:hypothetical protein
MEGITIKNYFRQNIYGRQLFVKIVRQEFKEANAGVFGIRVGKLEDDTSRLIETFITEPRIRKAIYRLRDEQGCLLSRTIMHFLPRAVIEDLMKEEAWTLVKDFSTIRFDVLKKAVPKKCLTVVDKMMDENVPKSSTT